ncbi:enoyl-CoA hydratase/isomerase family protein [uncultured Bartonella sp.]|uniref:enoyl-CoA hydratase/isomerase family protein n=1 Tax=uncultured Bartonella sp. TaxID=104108 RepID=UPI0025D2C701|nr:enoyl-CoA hydratase/isomerase family protein [uncultured Bartonella sp.]
MQLDFGGGEEVTFLKEGRAGIVRLTRPQALNALSFNMVLALEKALHSWETDDDVLCVVIEGEGRAFCSGGDVVSAYKAGKGGKPAYDYFSSEYRLNGYIGRFPKPYIAILDGICMGGGAGISVHGSHRIVTENTLFAMPEGAIGFFPDVGAGDFLSRLNGHFGMYLALTGARCKWGDCLQTGLATHAVSQDNLEELRASIIDQGNPRPALEKYAVEVNYETNAETRSLIADCFNTDSLEACINQLKQKVSEGSAFAEETLGRFSKSSPTSLMVIWRAMKQCKPLGLNDCLKLENRIAHHMMDNHDFYEGVRAVLIDKDNKPNWLPDTLSGVTDEMVDSYFQPIEHELDV